MERIIPSSEVDTMDSLNESFANVGPKLLESINQSPGFSINQQVQSFYLKH